MGMGDDEYPYCGVKTLPETRVVSTNSNPIRSNWVKRILTYKDIMKLQSKIEERHGVMLTRSEVEEAIDNLGLVDMEMY
jgi:uncharacterized protein (DUF1499 family)